MKRWTTALVAVAAYLLAAQPAVAEEIAPAHLVVDAPPAIECPNADFASIQAAVAAAPPRSRIRVCPGLYNESVTVPKTLTLLAPRRRGRATGCPRDPATDPTRYAIVDSPGVADGFRLQADAIELKGFVVQGNLRGIVTDPAFSGYAITQTIAQANRIGIAFGSGGAVESTVERSCLRATGIGINSFLLRNAAVKRNTVTQNSFGAALVNGADVKVTHNELTDNRPVGIFVSNGSDISIRHNRVARSDSGVVSNGSTGEVVFNRVDQARVVGVSLVSSDGVSVRSNDVRDSGVGMELIRSDGNAVRGNVVRGSDRDGMLVAQSNDNVLERNSSRANGADGLRLSSQSSGNMVRRNLVRANGEHDCHDDTAGAGTAGTANLWIRNDGRTENRPGLCERRPDSKRRDPAPAMR